MRQTGKDNKK